MNVIDCMITSCTLQVITENNLKDPQFPELLSLLCELRTRNVGGVRILLGRYIMWILF